MSWTIHLTDRFCIKCKHAMDGVVANSTFVQTLLDRFKEKALNIKSNLAFKRRYLSIIAAM